MRSPVQRELFYKKGRETMLYAPATKKAMKLCFAAHKDQMDKNGVPYVFHPFHLAEQMQDEQTTVAARPLYFLI